MATKALHFFPGVHLIIWVVDGKASIKAEAWGGEVPVKGVKYDVMKPRPTTPGRYVIHSYAPYETKTWAWSKIHWGTRLKVDSATGEVLFETGLRSPAWEEVGRKIPGVTTAEIQKLYYALYGDTRLHDADGDYIPDTWVFNDFGANAVRYFVDLNKNRKLDGREHLSGEMIHTTPENEAQDAKKETVTLAPSHGCIHVKPSDREALLKAGAFARGTDLVIHKYGEKVPATLA